MSIIYKDIELDKLFDEKSFSQTEFLDYGWKYTERIDHNHFKIENIENGESIVKSVNAISITNQILYNSFFTLVKSSGDIWQDDLAKFSEEAVKILTNNGFKGVKGVLPKSPDTKGVFSLEQNGYEINYVLSLAHKDAFWIRKLD